MDESRILLKLCRFEVFGVTKTHLNSEIIDGEIDIEDYNLIRRDRPGRQGGGCAIYYRKSLKAIHRPDLEDEQVEGICDSPFRFANYSKPYIPATKPKQ